MLCIPFELAAGSADYITLEVWDVRWRNVRWGTNGQPIKGGGTHVLVRAHCP